MGHPVITRPDTTKTTPSFDTTAATGQKVRVYLSPIHIAEGRDRLSNTVLEQRFPEYSAQDIVKRTGIESRPILARDQSALSIGVEAAKAAMQAEGLTPEELKAVITQQLSEYIGQPDVTVIVSRMNSNTVSVLGGVARPGLVALLRNTRVLDVIAQSGGFTQFARKNRVRILRSMPGGEQVEYPFDYGKFIDGRAPASNLLLEPGDTVVVPD